MSNQLNVIAEKFLKDNKKEFMQKNYKECNKALNRARDKLESGSPIASDVTLKEFNRYHPISKPSGNFKKSWKVSTKKVKNGYSFKVYNKYPELTTWLANGHRLIQGSNIKFIGPNQKLKSAIRSAAKELNNLK